MTNNDRARDLRNNMTEAERALWNHLKRKQMAAHKFRRQCALGPYIVDFVCLEKMLVLEVDGGQHALQQANDAKRTEWLSNHGYKVLRFWNHQVLQETDAVLEVIRKELG
jgi:very-short-patch-repair endonuclease